jgi:hypothetical protein
MSQRIFAFFAISAVMIFDRKERRERRDSSGGDVGMTGARICGITMRSTEHPPCVSRTDGPGISGVGLSAGARGRAAVGDLDRSAAQVETSAYFLINRCFWFPNTPVRRTRQSGSLAEQVMKVDSPKNMDQVVGTCCRQSPLRGLVGGLIVCALLIGFVFVLWHRGVPWFVWGGCAVLAALLVPWFFADALAKFGSANWLLWLRPDGLWINLRS